MFELLDKLYLALFLLKLWHLIRIYLVRAWLDLTRKCGRFQCYKVPRSKPSSSFQKTGRQAQDGLGKV